VVSGKGQTLSHIFISRIAPEVKIMLDYSKTKPDLVLVA
jgi:hypothetical protein